MDVDRLELIFESGVARFDASNNLFVHLAHGPDDPAPFSDGAGKSSAAPGGERRARVLGGGGAGGKLSGAFDGTADLPRGLVIELRGYESAELDAKGRLRVVVPSVTERPDWLPGAGTLRLGRTGEPLRLWAKSSLPEGVRIGAEEPAGKPKTRKQGARPTTTVAEKPAPSEPAGTAAPGKRAKPRAAAAPAGTAPEPRPDPQPEPAPESQPESPPDARAETRRDPYRPERPPAGSYTSDRLNEKKSGPLGCLGGLTIPALLAAAAVPLLQAIFQ
jgi:hypothetical protein